MDVSHVDAKVSVGHLRVLPCALWEVTPTPGVLAHALVD